MKQFKAFVSGAELSFALRQLKKELPAVTRIIITANGHLEILGLAYSEYYSDGPTKRVSAPCDTVFEGTINVESFEMLYNLTQDKAIKETTLTLESEEDRWDRDAERLLVKPHDALDAMKSNFKKGVHGYSGTTGAEYRFATFEHDAPEPVAEIETVTVPDSVPEPEKAQSSEVRLHEPVQSVTIPSAALKVIIPRGKYGSLTIAATSTGVHVGGTALSMSATAARFYITVPLDMIREAVKAGPSVTIGILEPGRIWNGLHETHRHSRSSKRDTPRYHVVKNGTVNGKGFHEQTQFHRDWQHELENTTPYIHAIGYRDEREVEGEKGKEKIYGPWHYIRVLTAPSAIARQIALSMSAKAGRALEAVCAGRIGEETDIVIEPEVHLLPRWEVLKVDRKSPYGEYWNVFATIKTANGNGKYRLWISRGLSDASSKLLTKRPDIAARMINEELSQEAVIELLAAK